MQVSRVSRVGSPRIAKALARAAISAVGPRAAIAWHTRSPSITRWPDRSAGSRCTCSLCHHLTKVVRVPAHSRRRQRARATAVGLLAGVLLDQVAGDPRRGHPVALFGRAAEWLEARTWRDDRAAGARYAALLVAGPVVLGLAARRLPAPGLAAATALGTWTVLGGRSLSAEAEAVAAHLRRADLPAARPQLTPLDG